VRTTVEVDPELLSEAMRLCEVRYELLSPHLGIRTVSFL
jgi:hypothetical protein